ncbi:MAG TPA: carboxymuconolactone decarboxylase family protein [Galbitalea sp.]|nr:carboxymuconolactone decarboxylase family protein [Galbitalea sp.]
MSTRTSIGKSAREGYRKVVELDAYVTDNIEFELVNLVYLRASFINGCNYCVDAHSTDLIKGDIPVRKVFGVSTWKESTFFSERERLAFEFTDAVTNIAGGISDDLWERGTAEFGEKGLGDLILAIGTINLWNRIAIPTHLPVPPLA